MTKAALRQQFLAKRKALSAENVQIASEAICQRFMAMLPGYTGASSGLTLHLFLPIIRQNEIDTWLIVHRIWRDFPAIQLTTSITDTAAKQLSHYVLTPDIILLENRWGIPEPASVDRYVTADAIDVVLVPLLIADKSGIASGTAVGFTTVF